jgi:hypothetical protein
MCTTIHCSNGIRAEYLEMPGLRLTLPQAQQFFGLERTHCETGLDALVQEASLSLKPNGTYAGRPADRLAVVARTPPLPIDRGSARGVLLLPSEPACV